MKLKIFGKLTDIFQSNNYQIEEENISTVAELRKKLEEKFPELKETTYSVIVMGTKAENDTAILKDVEIALLPPYSGG